MLNIENGRAKFFQWDIEQRLVVSDPEVIEVHFSNAFTDAALVCEVYEESGKRYVNVPNILLQHPSLITVYGCCAECVRDEATYQVARREKPDDYVYTETEVKRYDDLEERIEALEQGGGSGSDGNDGFSPIVNTTEVYGGYRIDITDAEGTESITLRHGKDGSDGAPGKDGADGAPGKTAYQYAQDGGYTGSEAEFAARMAKEVPDGVLLFAPQTLTAEQQVQARENIGAASEEEVERLSEEMNDISEGTVSIPDYWENAVNEVEARLADLQSKGGVDSSTFGFITDTHTGRNSSGNFAKLMEHVMRKCNIPLLLHGGDFISGGGITTKEGHLAEIAHHNYIFRNLESKMLAAMGNHEAVYGVDANYDSTLTTGEIYNYIFRKNEQKDGLVFGETGTYFYRDIPAQKTRYIVLDCYDFKSTTDENQKILQWSKLGNAKIGSTQLMWLADTALKVPDGYSIVICSHVAPLLTAELPTGWSEDTGCLADAEIVRGVVDAYINKTTYTHSGDVWYGCVKDVYTLDLDFTEYPGEIVCWCSGHTHMDKIFDLNGLHVVVTANCSSHIQPIDAPNKTPGTDTEYIMDFVCVNKRTRACNVLRLGAALEEDATCTINTYANLVDKTGEGWDDGHRINAVGEVVEASGYTISNYIPVCNKDVLLFKGWTKSTNFVIVQFYNAMKETIQTWQWEGRNNGGWFAPDYDADVIGIDTNLALAAGTENCRYARISGPVDTAAELIAVVNEDIKSTEQPGRGYNF